MGIQSFAGSSSSLPGQTFIDQVYLTFKVRKWARAGSPGFYRATSALGKDGFVYFMQNNGTMVQAPLNGIANVTHPFTEVRILATQFDMISLFKVSAKGTDSLTLTPNYTKITSSGNYAFPTNSVGFADAWLIGGGGAATPHGGGGGGGGITEVTSAPLPVGATVAITIGAVGGDTVFQGRRASRGGPGADGNDASTGFPTAGGSGSGSPTNNRSRIAGDGGVATINADKSLSTYLATLGSALTVPLPEQDLVSRYPTPITPANHTGGGCSDSLGGHIGGGGGGIGGAGVNSSSSHNHGGPGGAPITGHSPWGITSLGVHTIGAGGHGGRHSPNSDGATRPPYPAGFDANGHGNGSNSRHSSTDGGSGGVAWIRTWSV
jgi:hypothetical protein